MPFGPYLQNFWDNLPEERRERIRQYTRDLQAEIEAKKLHCPVCTEESPHLMKFMVMDTPLCWKCVWSFIDVQRKVLKKIREMREGDELFQKIMARLIGEEIQKLKNGE